MYRRGGSVSSTSIICKTSSVLTAGSLPVTVKFGDSALPLDVNFVYTENPIITNIEPRAAFRRCTLTRSHHPSHPVSYTHLTLPTILRV